MAQETPSLLNLIKTAAGDVTGETRAVSENSNYPKTALVREAQNNGYGIGNSYNNISTPPGFYSPFLTTSSFQIPNNRKEVYLWAQFFYDNDPKVAAGINFYTDFVFSGFKLESESSYVTEYYEELVKKLNFSKWLPEISREYHLLGDSFPFLSIECPLCGGSNINNKTGNACTHEGATWKSISTIDPNQIEISPGFVDKEPYYYFVPNDEMIRIVQSGQPENIFRSIPEYMRSMILSKQSILLEPSCVHHFKRAAAPWSPYGTSLVRSLFPVLAYKDKIRQANYITAERHILPIRLVTVGTDDRPANEEDINNVQEQLAARAQDPLLTIVSHHGIKIEWIGAGQAVKDTSNEHENIENDLLDGLMLSKEILAGSQAAGNNIGLLALDRRLERFRLEVKEWIEEKIFKPVAKWNGFVVENKNGHQELIYPRIKWNDLEIRDQSNRMQQLQTLQQANLLSAQTLLEAYDIDYNQEVERLRFEQNSAFTPNPPAEMGALGGFGGGMGGMDMGMGGMDMGMGGPEMGGMGGPEMGGMPAPGAEMGGMEAGGAMPPAPPAGGEADVLTINKNENYRLASGLIYNLVAASGETANVPKQFLSEAHKRFVLENRNVTGRGLVGALDKKFTDFIDKFQAPLLGGDTAIPLNNYAKFELGRVVAAGKKKKKDEGPGIKLFTGLEQKLYGIIMGLNLPLPVFAQFTAGPTAEFQIDAAYPTIRLGIEADSTTFHSSPQQIAKDRRRDMLLAGEGWTILRFTDTELEKKPEEVARLISTVVRQIMSAKINGTNKSATT